ncbi:MAG TPA: hypothetical protein V6D06_10625 [Trichocoleus sp.]
MPLGAPLLVKEAINVDQQGQVIEYGVTHFRADQMELVFENDLSQDCGLQQEACEPGSESCE